MHNWGEAMKFRITLIVLVVAMFGGCAVAHQTVMPDGRKGLSINCSGSAMTWNNCYEKAGEQCPGGYDIISKDGDGTSGFGAGNGWAFGSAASTRTLLVACKSI